MTQSLRLRVARRQLKRVANSGKRMEVAPYNGNLFDTNGRVYVRNLGGYDTGSSSIRSVPSPIPIEPGKNVFVGAYRIVIVKTDIDGRDYITGNDGDDLKYAGINPRQLNANVPSVVKSKTLEQIANLNTYATGNDGTVKVFPGIYRKSDGDYNIFEGQLDIDLLTSYTPSAGNQHIVCLWINEATNAVTITTSDELTSATDLKLNPSTAVTYINQAVADAPTARVGIGSYIITSDNTTISETDKFHDLRGIIDGYSQSQVVSFVDQSGGTSDTYGTLAGTINGSNTTFTVSQGAYNSGSLFVYLNGQLQTQGTSEDWTETTPSSGTFDFVTAPISGDQITAYYETGDTTTPTYTDIVLSKTADYTITGNESSRTIMIKADCTSGDVTITLPASGTYQNRQIIVKRMDASGNSVIVDANGSQTIDGSLTVTLIAQYTTLSFWSDGSTDWSIV